MTCEKQHSFETNPYRIISGKWCPFCVNKTESIVLDFLQTLPFLIETQKTFDWTKTEKGKHFRFDFSLPELKILIELDGAQHFKQISNWSSPEHTRDKDVIKMSRAIENGWTVIRILQEDVFNNKNDWKGNLMEVIKSYDEPTIIYIDGESGIYTQHQEDLNQYLSLQCQIENFSEDSEAPDPVEDSSE